MISRKAEQSSTYYQAEKNLEMKGNKKFKDFGFNNIPKRLEFD